MIGVVLFTLPITVFSQHKLSGKVTNANGEPVVDAIVGIENTYRTILTDIDGGYEFVNLKAGSYKVTVSHVGFQPKSKTIDVNADMTVDFTLPEGNKLKSIVIQDVFDVNENTPMAYTKVDRDDINELNLGQDLPFLVRFTPSVVTTSDAGAGVGYTGFRIRGSDASRINVTVNGVPLNDAESQGVFWVNMPDFASTTDQIQIQRGVGTSTNGAGAFGGSVNIQSSDARDSAYGEFNNSFGSFNTHKHTILFGTGKINGHWSFDGRLSGIFSDGYVDRATSDLRSYYLAGGYYGEKTTVRAITFAGAERTYQSWWGVPEAVLSGDEEAITEHYYNNLGSIYNTEQDSVNLFESGRNYNYYTYDREVDNYNQDHYQLHFQHQFNKQLSLRVSGHYTYGRGYFEQFRLQDDMSDYAIDPINFSDPGDTVFIPNPIIPGDTLFYDVFGDTSYTINQTDLIRRRWLDNDFYGGIFNLNYTNGKRLTIDFGGGWNQYDGDHYGEIIWAQYANNTEIRDRFYDNRSIKTDMNSYLKARYWINEDFSFYGDLQVRNINYLAGGIDIDQRFISIDTNFLFFNPKAGLTYNFNDKHKLYGSFAIANREPVRNDFIDAPAGRIPSHETLYDYELGYEFQSSKFFINANLYYMDYQNQLVLTGELNDVGSAIRTNVDESYRAGVELSWGYQPVKRLNWAANLTLSQNKIGNFEEVIYDYTNGFDIQTNEYSNTDIAFSPNIIAASQLTYEPVDELEVSWQTKYVGKQYLDNTSNDNRAIDPYLVNNIRLTYAIHPKWMEEIEFNVLVNNVLNEQYSSNGYTYSFIFGDLITENFYYPQAGINFLAGINLRF